MMGTVKSPMKSTWNLKTFLKERICNRREVDMAVQHSAFHQFYWAPQLLVVHDNRLCIRMLRF